MREEIQKWLERAKRDLKTARNSLKSGDYYASAFFSQQAAEKALKALYILKFRKLWKTHDLVSLLVEVKGGRSLLEICDELNRHYIETRYPTETEYTEEVANDAFEKARKVLEWVRKKIK